jgi:hypothetical protein
MHENSKRFWPLFKCYCYSDQPAAEFDHFSIPIYLREPGPRSRKRKIIPTPKDQNDEFA